jgi:hypothetical protein
MTRFTHFRAAALAFFCAVSGAAAAAPPTIFLSCPVTGVASGGDGVPEPISETVEVEVEEDQWLTIVLYGRSFDHFMSAEDLETDGIISTGKNHSRGHVWDLTVNIRYVDTKRAYEATVAINRISGLFRYSRKGVTSSGEPFEVVARGTCIKRSAKRKF